MDIENMNNDDEYQNEHSHESSHESFTNPEGGIKSFANNSWTLAMTYIMLGFSLTAALAWVDLVRALIKNFVPVKKDASVAHLVFAIIVTILAVLVFMIIKNYLATDMKDVPIMGVIGR
jgi:uncharacterized membrane protein YdbT with pleckstrin-like domain